MADRQRALDGLRFLAALSVALFHLVAVAGHGAETVHQKDIWGQPPKEAFGGLYDLSAYLWVGVPLFFMISGFVICMSGWGRTPAQFAISRVVRLFPAYWAAIALTTAFLLAFPLIFEPRRMRDILANVTMIQTPLGASNVDGVYWTLLVELKFYLLFLVLLWFGVTYRRVVAFCILWSIGAVVAVESNFPLLKAVLVPEHSQYFVAGVALYLLYRFGSNLVLWCIIGYSWVIAMYHHNNNPFPTSVGMRGWPAGALITVCLGLMILLALGKLEWLRWRGLTTLGATTYPLYLMHYAIGTTVVFLVTSRTGLGPWIVMPAVIICLVLASWMIHRLVERPLSPVFKRRLSAAAEQITKARPRSASAT